MSNYNTETVIDVRHWTDRLFTFRTTRSPSLRFRSGQFVMIGLETGGKPLARAYSIASGHWQDELEFFSIKVQDGPLTSRLQHLSVGDKVLVSRKPTGTLVIDNLRAGENLYLLGTGTGLAPWLSLARDPEVYERFRRIVVVHGVRFQADLAYRDFFTDELPSDELIGDLARGQLIYHPMVTREPFVNPGRISAALRSGELARSLGLPNIDRARDRFMLCGSPAMLADVGSILEGWGFEEGNYGEPGDYVIEKAFVEK